MLLLRWKHSGLVVSGTHQENQHGCQPRLARRDRWVSAALTHPGTTSDGAKSGCLAAAEVPERSPQWDSSAAEGACWLISSSFSFLLRFFCSFSVQVPGPAPNLQAVSNAPTSVSLSWDKPLTGNGDIVTYKLYYTDKSLGSEQVGCSPPPLQRAARQPDTADL